MTKLQTSLSKEETWVDGATEKLTALPTATSALELDVSKDLNKIFETIDILSPNHLSIDIFHIDKDLSFELINLYHYYYFLFYFQCKLLKLSYRMKRFIHSKYISKFIQVQTTHYYHHKKAMNLALSFVIHFFHLLIIIIRSQNRLPDFRVRFSCCVLIGFIFV